MAATADDVRTIADFFRIERFAVVGRSGGGPHALAVAAGLPDRVTAVAVLASFAPLFTRQDIQKRMFSGNVHTFALANDQPSLLEDLQRTARRAAVNPEHFIVERIHDGLIDPDFRVVEDMMIRRQLKTSYAEALRDGDSSGWEDDILALNGDWGFRLAEVGVPTLLWHGADDNFSPVENTYWLASQLPQSEVEVDERAGHFAAVEVLPRVLSWLVDHHREATDKADTTVESSLSPAGTQPSGQGQRRRTEQTDDLVGIARRDQPGHQVASG